MPKSKKVRDCVFAYSEALNLHFTKVFGEGYVLSITKVKQNLLLIVNYFFNKMYVNYLFLQPLLIF